MPISLILKLLKAVFEFLKANKKAVAIALFVLALYGAGFYNGASSEQERQAEIERKYQADLQAEKDEWQDKANKVAAAYETDKLKTVAILAKTKRDLKNELEKNTVLRDCTASSGFVQLYESNNR